MKIKSYAEGGFLDDGATVDPMSGNEVPTGSLQEEVRDDIPAQLSEGEFVVPADVVRFIGLDKLMKMRDSAKKGLASMEAEGQIGGSPSPQGMPMDMGMEMPLEDDDIAMDALIDGMDGEGFDEQAMNFAEGGMPTYEEYTGRKFKDNIMVEYTKYSNEEGDIITIKTINGKPLQQVPEGYTLYIPPPKDEFVDPIEEEFVDMPTTNNQDARDFAQNGGREEQAAEIASSDSLGRDRYDRLQKISKFGNTQVGIDALWDEMTGQEKSLYQSRFKDLKSMGGLDSFFTKGMSPVDRMMSAIQTTNTINSRRGLSITKSQDSMYSDKPLDVKKMISVLGRALLGGIPGMLTAAEVGELGVDSSQVKSAARKFVMSGLGQRSGIGDESIQPSTYTPTEYNQEYWKNFVGASSAEIDAEKLRIARETGLGAYGKTLTEAEIKDLNRIARAQDIQDKSDRTVAERERKLAYDINEKEIQAELDRVESEELQTIYDREGRETSAEEASGIAKIAREESIRKAAASAATQKLLDDQNRRQQGQSTGNGGDGRGQRQRDAEAGNGFGQGNANQASEDEGQTDYGYMNRGGLASKKKPAVMKMRKDPTSGIAAKKKSKQKAQAKKGALAAKRT